MSDGQSHGYGHLSPEELDDAVERARDFVRLVSAAEREIETLRRQAQRELDNLWMVWAERQNRG